MKNHAQKGIGLLLALWLLCLLGCGAAEETAVNEPLAIDLELIHGFLSSTNHHDVEGYISLFSSEIQNEMRDFIARSPENADAFFASDRRELLSIERVDAAFAVDNDWLFVDAFDTFDVFDCYYVTENVHFKEEDGDIRTNGEQANVYVIAEENGQRRLYRVSSVGRELIESYLTPLPAELYAWAD